MIRRVRTYLWWRRDVRRLQAEALCAYTRWRAAYASCQAMAEVFRDEPDAWGATGMIGRAMNAVDDFREQWRSLEARLQRTVDLGPIR